MNLSLIEPKRIDTGESRTKNEAEIRQIGCEIESQGVDFSNLGVNISQLCGLLLCVNNSSTEPICDSIVPKCYLHLEPKYIRLSMSRRRFLL